MMIILSAFLLITSCKKEEAQIPTSRDVTRTIESDLSSPNQCSYRTATNSIDMDGLLPKDMNPVQIDEALCGNSGMDVDGFTKVFFKNFDSGTASNRNLDYFAQLDGGTMGMGHWPQHELYKLFGDLIKNESAKKAFIGRIAKSTGKDYGTTEERLNAKILNPSFLESKYSKPCSPRTPNGVCKNHAKPFFAKDFSDLIPHIKTALRDRTVARWQLNFYKKEDIDPSIKTANALGIKSVEGKLMIASMRSSFSGITRNFEKEILANRSIKIGSERFSWDKPKIKVKVSADQKEKALESWRVLKAFQFYTYKKGKAHRKGCKQKLRSRQKHLYCNFAKRDWSKYWPEAKKGDSSCRSSRSNPQKLSKILDTSKCQNYISTEAPTCEKRNVFKSLASRKKYGEDKSDRNCGSKISQNVTKEFVVNISNDNTSEFSTISK